MRKTTRRFLALMPLLMVCTCLTAQDNKTQMADVMRENGRIYVVVAVVLTILAGLIIYLVRIDRKVSRLEKNK
jgi:hypothetical protein